MIKRMKQGSAKLDIDAILKEAQEPQEHVRVTLYLSKSALEAFKRKCGTLSVSKAFDVLLRRLALESKE